MALQFEWDEDKAVSNLQKHGVSFDEASTVFTNPLAVLFDDEEHSDDEIREIAIGHTILQRLVLVFFTERGEDLIRIISARKATKRERRDHEEGTRS
ncbi:MAG: BrnT family toxin [Planctomycetota bacterium]